MSFGFGVGDFIAVGELCWKIYTRVYKVSRDAPEELRALIQELGNLSNTMNLLNEEVRDKEEWIKRADVRRLEYTCKVMSQARETLGKMDRLADRYAELDPGANSQGSKRSLRIQWNRIKYALEVSSINELRSKFMSHNFHLTLLLQGAQNSSLERIEKQQTKTDIKLEELRNAMIGDRSSRKSPLLKAPLDEEVRAELSAAFLRSAETGNRPWASIGIDDWLQAGKWWLLKARSQINHLAQGSGVEVQAYVNLLKTCWILTDIVSIHPQRTHLGASNDRRNDDIRNLSQIAKTTLENFPVFDFQLHDVEDYTMNIWLQASPLSTIAPRRQLHINRDSPNWQTSEGEVLFQCFAEICSTTEETENAPEECYFILEVPQQGFFLNAILQSFAGQDIFKLKVEPHEHRVDFVSPRSDAWQELQGRVEKLGSSFRVLNLDALLAFLWGFQLFASAFQPASLSVSTIHSVSVLANWRSQDRSCLLLPGYDTGCPTQSDSLALLLRTIISDLNEKDNKDMSPTSKLLAIDCMNGKYSLGALAWKLICWRCEKFSDIKSLLEEFNVGEHLRDDLLQTAFLRLDHDFLSQLVQYMNYEDGWNPPDILIMVEAALTSDDVRHLLWMLERVAASVLSENQTAISQRVYSSRRLEHIDAMMQVIVPRPADIAAALAWYLGSSDEQSFKHFLHTFQCLGRSFHRKTADEVDFSDFYPLFVDGCGHLIESQCSNTLSLYLDSLEGLGIDFHFIEGRKNTESSQLAVIPALVSPDPSFLRILLERQVVAPDMQPFIVEYRPPNSLKYPDSPALIQYPPPSMPHWPLYCALMLVCDVEYLQLLCQNGASLQQESKDFQDHQNKAQGILDHLSRLSSLEEARLEHMEALMFCHILIHVGIKGWHFCSNSPDLFKATGNTLDTTDYRKTWRRMERLLYHDSFFLSCSYPCDRARKGSWKSQPGVRSELISRYAKFPGHYPKHLRTQTSWDAWRRDALQILMKQTHEALIVRSETR